MVRVIRNKNIITAREAREKYAKYYFGFVTTEQNMLDTDNEKGYVVYITDSREEGYTMPGRTDDGAFIALLTGYSVGGTELGIIIFEGV